MDFLIHLSEPEKEKLEEIAKPNLSVRYKDYTLSREDVSCSLLLCYITVLTMDTDAMGNGNAEENS